MKTSVKILLYATTAAVIVAATWIVTLTTVRSDYQARLQAGIAKADELATFFEADTVKTLVVADNFVREARREYLFYADTAALTEFYNESVPHNDLISHMAHFGPSGVVLEQTGQGPVEALEPELLAAMRADTTDKVYITPPDSGRTNGRLTVGLIRRIGLPDGSFAGAILAAINVEEFTDFFDTLSLGPNSSATLIGFDKKIRARSSYGTFGPGQHIPESLIWDQLSASSVGGFQQTSGVDDITRMFSYRTVPNYPLVVEIGIAEEDVISGAQPFSRSLYTIAALVSAVVIVLIAMLCYAHIAQLRLQKQVVVRRQAEQELEAANKDLSQFAYAASHDLKAPLSSIRGLLEFCLEDLDSGDLDEVRQNTADAIDISKRAAKKIESLLRLAKSGSVVLPKETFSLDKMISDIWKDQTGLMDESCFLDLQIKGSPKVNAEKAAMQVILENLISNAVRYRDPSKKDTKVRVFASFEGESGTIVIGDNGVGIADKDQSKVFEMFTRADDRSGDGLGLALVKKNVDRLGAKMEMRSQLGAGTEFELRFVS